MRAYTDIFKQPLDKEQVVVAIRWMIAENSASPSMLQRKMRIGFAKAATILRLLEDAGVITKASDKPRSLIIKRVDMATNAALRQLKRSKK